MKNGHNYNSIRVDFKDMNTCTRPPGLSLKSSTKDAAPASCILFIAAQPEKVLKIESFALFNYNSKGWRRADSKLE
jgi:hypothetical protein